MIQRFSVQRFAADGGFTFGGAILLVLSTFAVGAALGALASFLGQWFYLVGVFPLFIGLIVGAVAAWAVKLGHVRSGLIAGVSALLAGCVAMLTMHYSDYLRFQSEMRDFREKGGAAVLALLDHLEKANGKDQQQPVEVKVMVDAARVETFPQFVDFNARQGVRIGRASQINRDPDKGMNLGYIGTYIYWGVEVLLVAGIAFAMAMAKAREPYCTQCNTWKESRVLGSVLPPAETAVDALGQGDLNLLGQNHPNCEPGELMVSASVCPTCNEQSPIDVKLERVTKSDKGESKKKLTQVTYPGNALPALANLFSAPPPAPPVPQSPAPAA